MSERYLQVALNIPVNQTFTYLDSENDEGLSRTGCRVEVKFGNRRMIGVAVSESEQIPPECPVDKSKIRPILRCLDSERVLTEELYETAAWLSKYYLCAIGEAVSLCVPGGKRESEGGGFSFAEESPDTKACPLSEEQKDAVEGILSNRENLLHYLYGPTGSGKTEVFLQVTEKLLSEGKSVIYLVPEIGLTSQVIEAVTARFKAKYGNTVALLHSALTPSQRLLQWHRILNGEARVIIGARSAVFAPALNLGMIIIDEEHDSSYKSGNTPRYHARQVAMYRCARLKIPLLMGSATPGVEAWKMMEEGKIKKHILSKRLAGGAMPKIECVDISNVSSDYGAISPFLQREITKTLEEKRQAILFLNRRGFTHFFRCNSCGFEMKCKNCSVSLTFHKAEKRLRCHYCGYSVSPPQICPACGSVDVGYSGFGTEFIETEVKAKFPNARIVRVDTDSVSHKGELQEKITAFKNGEYDILLGTQMVSKGLNFPNLKLVGVVLADTGLHMPDFRAAERTFSLITQVAGRAGRFFPDGRVIVQTFCPDSPPLLFAAEGKINEFYDSELTTRDILNFPPYSRMLRIVFRAPAESQAEKQAEEAAVILKNLLEKLKADKTSENIKKAAFETEILGPSECPLSKIAANYRQQLILRGQEISVLQYLASSLSKVLHLQSDVYAEYDVDPVSLL